MVATRSARFSRCVLRCQGSRSPSTALMLRAACSIPPIQTPNPSKNGPSSSRYPTVNHFRPKPIGGEGQSLCYVGDLAHHPVLLLEKPLTEFKYDTDPKQSAQTRVKMLTMLADKKIPLLAYHFAWPGIGHVAKQGDGFHYYPKTMKMEL